MLLEPHFKNPRFATDSCSKINEVQVRVSSYVFLVLELCLVLLTLEGQNNAWFSSYTSFAYLECHCNLFRRVRSKTCSLSVATLLSS